jgi:beta-lactamase class D
MISQSPHQAIRYLFGNLRNAFLPSLFILLFLLLVSCKNKRVTEHNNWGNLFKAYGIDSGTFIMRDHAHETIHLYNRARSLERFTPASTFKIFNALVSLETSVAPDDRLVIPWNGVVGRPEWNKDMDMREAFKTSNLLYFQELARRVGRRNFQHYLDTVKYGNMKIGPHIDSFWIDNSLLISPDEQIGFVRKLYFDELPFLARTQTIVKTMMLREDSSNNRFYYKTGTGFTPQGNKVLWVVGYLEHILRVKEAKESMNKSGVRTYPYFYALNFEVPRNDTSRNWFDIRIKLLHELLKDYGATRDE